MRNITKIILLAAVLKLNVACQGQKNIETEGANQSNYSDPINTLFNESANKANASRSAIKATSTSTNTNSGLDITKLNALPGEHICFLLSPNTNQVLAQGVLRSDLNSALSHTSTNGHTYAVNHVENDGSGLALTVFETNVKNISQSKFIKMAQISHGTMTFMNDQYLINCQNSGTCGTYQKDAQNSFQKIQVDMDIPNDNESPLLNKMGVGTKETGLLAKIDAKSNIILLGLVERDMASYQNPSQLPPWNLTGFGAFGSNSVQIEDKGLVYSCVQVPNLQN